MSMFIRRFTSDPGNDVLLEIESINILDLDPPASIRGIGTGTVLMVGEFEDGPFNTPTEVTSADDMVATFGSLGYVVAGTQANNPCAVSRTADGAVVAEKWNGNGMVQLSGKKFRRLLLVRVDTSVGSVTFSRLAYVTGGAAFRYTLTSGQVLSLDIGAGPVASTFTGTVAVVTGSGGTFPTLFAGGETLTLKIDAMDQFVVTFLAADQSNAQVRDRINTYAGFALCDLNGGQLRFTGRQKGTGGKVQIVAGSTGVLAQLGLTAATTAGGGNVSDISQVTPAEVKTIVELAVAGTKVETDSQGRLRISNTTALTGTILVHTNTTATGLGFTNGATGSAASGVAGVIPAGTVVQVDATHQFVTMESIDVTATNAGPYTVKIRPAKDDGTGTSATAGTVTVVPNAPDLGAFSCTNLALVSAALTESAIDAQYATAITSTIDLSSIAREANLIFSARQSNAIRRALKQNALDASGKGMFGRMACIRPPLGTAKATAQSISAEPGVGAYREQRVIYCYPGASTLVPLIARRGIGGGTGFTADGIVDVGADGFMASICSQLAPEENPGQLTSFTGAIIGLESSANAKGFDIVDYTNFKKFGIAALRIDEGTAIFQSGVTSVDPLVYPNLKNIARRRMADFIQDSMARRGKSYGKKLSTFQRRNAFVAELNAFLVGLKSENNPSTQRIDSFSLDQKSGNTQNTLGQGLFKVLVFVRTLASLDSIVIASTIGENVVVEEVLPQAA